MTAAEARALADRFVSANLTDNQISDGDIVREHLAAALSDALRAAYVSGWNAAMGGHH